MSNVRVKKIIELEYEFPGLGERIRKARESDKRTLTEICRACGVSRGYWYKLENEQLLGCATEDVIRKIEEVLNVNLGVVFD